ncbi:MAG: hypothetical protein JWP87_5162 [Labilithrix sp.]|nr:hypothetical protein [Labilithrix sp.]
MRGRVVRFAAVAAASIATLAAPGAVRADGSATRSCIDAATRGQKLRDEGKLLEARAALVACTRDPCPAPVRADCADWLARIDDVTPRIVLGARADGKDLVDVRVFANDDPIAEELLGREQRLDPGPYRFRFERRDGGGIATVDAVLRAGDPVRSIVATFPGAAKPGAGNAPSAGGEPRDVPVAGPSTKTIGLVALGAGAVLATASFAIFALRARSEYDDLRGSCSPSCAASDTSALRTNLVVADVSGIAALVFGVAFAGVAIFAPGQRPADRPRIVWK